MGHVDSVVLKLLHIEVHVHVHVHDFGLLYHIQRLLFCALRMTTGSFGEYMLIVAGRIR